jgi:hypothetical protein
LLFGGDFVLIPIAAQEDKIFLCQEVYESSRPRVEHPEPIVFRGVLTLQGSYALEQLGRSLTKLWLSDPGQLQELVIEGVDDFAHDIGCQ